MTKVAVLLPFGGDCPHRTAALEWVTARYDWPVYVGRHDGPWSKGAALADALTKTDADTLIVADGDVWTDDLHDAVAHIDDDTRWAIPHRQVRRLTRQATRDVLQGTEPSLRLPYERDYRGVPGGGIVIVPRRLYEQVPIDRRFVGWGGEDHSWGYALRAVAGKPWRGMRPLYHLWHPKQDRGPLTSVCASPESEQLRKRYWEATNDRHDPAARTLAIIREVT